MYPFLNSFCPCISKVGIFSLVENQCTCPLRSYYPKFYVFKQRRDTCKNQRRDTNLAPLKSSIRDTKKELLILSMRIQGGDTKSFAYFFLVSLIKDFNKGCIPCFTYSNKEETRAKNKCTTLNTEEDFKQPSWFVSVKQGIQPLLKSLIRDTKKKYAKLFVSPPCIRIDTCFIPCKVGIFSMRWFLHNLYSHR